MSHWSRSSAGLAAVALGAAAWAAQPVVYPAKGQNANQQKKDDGECKTWAKGNTGVDPAALAAAPPPAAPAPPPPGAGGQRVKGAAKGAAVGAVIGDSDDAKTGAAVGMVAGGSRARQDKRAQAQQQQQQASQQQAQQQQQMATYMKAWSACMEGRGYTVK